MKTEWQRIETCPKDGSNFIAYRAEYAVMVCFWSEYHNKIMAWEGMYMTEFKPTLWTPLPKSEEINDNRR